MAATRCSSRQSWTRTERAVDSWIVWASVFAAGSAYELWAIFNRRKGDTLTEKVKWLYRVPVIKFVGTAFLGWLMLHFLSVPGT